MEMERFNGKAKAEDQGAVALVLLLAKALSESALLWSGLGRRISASQGKYCGCCAVTLRRVQFEGCAAEPLTTITAILPSQNGVACFYKVGAWLEPGLALLRKKVRESYKTFSTSWLEIIVNIPRQNLRVRSAFFAGPTEVCNCSVGLYLLSTLCG